MLNDDITRILNEQANLYRQLMPRMKIYDPGMAISKFLEDIKQAGIQNQDLERLTFGPLEDLRRAGYSASTLQVHVNNEILGLGSLLAAEQRFSLPVTADVTKLLNEYKNELNYVTRYSQQMSEIHGMIESMRTPWLDIANQMQSVSGLTGLLSIGSALRTIPAFNTKLAATLRLDLGDWRRKVIWPSGLATDPLIRTSLYMERGLNPTLTAFPEHYV